MYGFGLIAVLIITGGLIAYLGDRIGRKVGRQRLTIWGIRPKYTSVLVTIITGVIIVAGTLAVLTTASEDVRTALFHMKEIQEALATSEQRYDESQARLAETEKLLEQQRAEADYLESEIVGKTIELQEMEAERDAAEKQLADAKAQLDEVTRAYETALQDYNTARQELEAAKNQIEFEQTRVENLKQVSERMQAKVDELQETEKTLEANVSYLLEEYQKLSEAYNQLNERMRFGNVAYRANEIVLAEVFEGGKRLEDTQNELISFLLRANKAALERGARIAGKENYALKLISQEHFDEAARTLSEGSGKYVVRAVSSGNTLIGEPVVVHFEVIADKLIFAKGEVIVRDVIDGSRPEDIEDKILLLLRQANEIAIERGMVTDPDGLVGQASGQVFLDALAAVRTAGKPVTVSVIAAHDVMRTSGPMNIIIEVGQ